MPPILPFALLLGYLVGLGSAALLLPRETIGPLSGVLTVTSVVVAAAAILAFLTRRRPNQAPAEVPVDEAPAASEVSSAGDPPQETARGNDAANPGLPAPAAEVAPAPHDNLPVPVGHRPDGPRLFGPLSVPEAISPSELHQALHEARIGAVLRPLVRPTPPGGAFCEATSRLCAADGAALRPSQYRQVAARLGLLGAIDRVFVMRCVRHLRGAADRSLRLLCRLDPDSLADPGFVAQIEALIADHPDLVLRLVLAIERAELSRTTEGAVARLRNQGIRFCLARLGADRLDPAELQRRGFSMVRLEGPVAPGAGPGELVRLEAQLEADGITLLVDRVENPRLGAPAPDPEAEVMAA